MKTRGIINATRRLSGARKLGSATLLAKAEDDARSSLATARAWIERTTPADDEARLNWQAIVEAADALEATLAEGSPAA
ncbi:hypothetical protein [Plasticicumulans acidivorans]|uniref:Uncharacterized protein n=1 Tax=Plasticicumulans acidivorans TaxID=886464 RepID=A0A317MTN0_9GAMM|nr:hypothetical protein [Plasticicumulans acidivorans]PWV61000.1 hypothetical protein C7443_10614 [Plasticicumulans acidivorans]